MFFSSKKRTILGVDIGTSYIKVAQVTHGEHKVLDTYGIVNLSEQIENANSEAVITQTATMLRNLLDKARVTTKQCVVSLPNSAVFTSVIDMPQMTDDELSAAMKFEAKKYVPLPFADVSLSWSVVSVNEAAGTIKVLLIAVPNLVRQSYVKIFELAGLDLEIIEIEALALIRSLVTGSLENNVIIIDIGAKSTGLNIIRNGLLQLTRNLNIGGDTMTDRIAQSLNITAKRAEQFKKDFGVSESAFVPEAIKPVLNSIKNEAKQLMSIYSASKLSVEKIVLVGGGSYMPGLVEHFADLGAPVVLGDPLKLVAYPQAAEPVLTRFGQQLTIALGLALRT